VVVVIATTAAVIAASAITTGATATIGTSIGTATTRLPVGGRTTTVVTVPEW
jgi:hypothetical protein